LTNPLSRYDCKGNPFVASLLHIATLEGDRRLAISLNITLRTWEVLERELERINFIISQSISFLLAVPTVLQPITDRAGT
jgi:hypothetical protein